MSTGAYISGGLHLALILWMLLGGVLFRAQQPTVMDSTDVQLLSEAQFKALTAKPEPAAAQKVAALQAPAKQPEATPQIAAAPAKPVESAPTPEIAKPAPAEKVPPKPELSPPVAKVDAANPTQPVAPPAQAMATLVPPTADAGAAQDAPRIAQVPQPKAPTQAQPSLETVPAVEAQPAPEAKTPPVKQTTAKAPPAATTDVLDKSVTKPNPPEQIAALRPPARPEPKPQPKPEPKPQPKPQPKPAPKPQPKPADTQTSQADAIAAAVAAAAAAESTAPQTRPVGPPLSYGQKEALRTAVGACWNQSALSTAASRVVVTIGVSMNPDGTLVPGSLHQISATGGDANAVRNAYETASRAIQICAARGLPLPADKYDQWAQIEMTFNPTKGVGVN